MKFKKKYIIFFTLIILLSYWGISLYVGFENQKEKDRLFCEDCKNSDKIDFKHGFIEIVNFNNSKSEYIDHFDILQIRNGIVIDTVEYTIIDDYCRIEQFDLRKCDTLQIQIPNLNIINIYGFKNEIEYVYPHKIIDCNFQSYIIDSVEYRVEEYFKVNIAHKYF